MTNRSIAKGNDNLQRVATLVVAAAFLLASLSSSSLAARDRRPAPADAKQLIQAAIAAMGGEAQLTTLKSVKLEGIGHYNLIEQSERPEGPYIVFYEQTSALVDLVGGRVRQTVENKNVQTTQWAGQTSVVADGVAAGLRGDKFFPAAFSDVQDAEIRTGLGPERVLLSARDAADLHADADTTLQGVAHHVVKFTWRKIAVTLFLNANTNLPTAVETLRAHPYEQFWSVWGDVRTRVYYSFWTLEAGGLRYPRQWDTERNNLPWRTITITTLALNAPIPADAMNIDDGVRQAFKSRAPQTIEDVALGRPDRPAHETAPGVVSIPGRWDVTLVKQSDGIVVVEAPISSG
jgi:hypothetical protein